MGDSKARSKTPARYNIVTVQDTICLHFYVFPILGSLDINCFHYMPLFTQFLYTALSSESFEKE